MEKLLAFSFNLNLNFASIAGIVCIVAAAVLAFATDFIMKLFKTDEDTSYSRKNLIKIVALLLAALGVIMVINA